jgi:hypothetical protein
MLEKMGLGLPFDFKEGLPTGLILAKPIEQLSYDPSILRAASQENQLLATRKWNGWRMIVAITPGESDVLGQEIKIYGDGIHKDGSRRRADLYLPHVVDDIKKLHFPPWTLLIAEAISENSKVEILGDVGKILQLGKAEDAISYQENHGRMKIILHGAMCWNDQWLQNTPYEKILKDLVISAPPMLTDSWVRCNL